MVGPDAERTATVRHFARMFLDRREPVACRCGTIVLRKGYGLGAQAMAGGGFKAPLFTVALADVEFGAMGLEGAVRLGHAPRARGDRGRRRARARCSRRRSPPPTSAAAALNMAAYGEIDDVIDPADSRRWIATLFDEHAAPWWQRDGKTRPYVDAW